LPPGRAKPGLIQHTVGWPVDSHTYGGSFIYHLDNDRVYVGYVMGLDYRDPEFMPFEAFQQFKTIPASSRCWKAVKFFPPAPARSSKAACSRCRNWKCPVRCWWATPPAP